MESSDSRIISSSETIVGKNEKAWPPTAAPALSSPFSQRATEMPPRVYVFKQHLAAFLANIPSLSVGIALGWSAPAVPVLRGVVPDPQPLRLSLEQGSWVSALMPLTSLGGALVSGPLAERIGRKGALLAIAAPTLLGWLLMTFAGPSLWLLLAGRVLTGLAAGAVSGPAVLYCEEIAEVRIRGALGSYQYMMNSMGFTWITGLGALLPYTWFTASALLPPVVFVLSFCWMPESPAFLAARGRQGEAHRALHWLRGPDIDFDLELQTLLGSKLQTAPSVDSAEKSFLSLCSTRPWRSTAFRSLFILLPTMFLQQMSGIGLFTFHTVQVYQEADGSISSHLSVFINGLGNMSAVFLTMFAVDRLGRRFLLIVPSFMMGVCLLGLSLYSYIKNNEYDIERWKWFPLASLLIYFILFGVGIGPVPWFLMAELLPMHAKGWASTLVMCVNRITMFIVAKQSPLMLQYAGEVPTYVMFGIFCLLFAAFAAMCIPETKGKTKADILREIGGEYP